MSANPTPTPTRAHRVSGGEIAQDISDRMKALSKRLLAEDDVHEVLEVIPTSTEGFWFYLIQTPFATWPRYVIGETTEDLSDVNPFFFCGQREEALERWAHYPIREVEL